MLPTIAIVIDTAIKLVFVWVLAYCFWRPYRTDALRQALFSLRDELFDLAADGHIAFDDPAYWRLRRTINCMIRFGHRLSFTRLVVAAIGMRGSALGGESAFKQWDQAVDAVESGELKQKIRHIHNRMTQVIVRHIVTGSPLLLLVLAILWMALCIEAAIALVKGAAKHMGAIEMISNRLPAVRALEDEAVRFNTPKVA